MSIDFSDFEWYVDQSGDYVLHNEIGDWVDQIARSLYPDEPTTDIDDSMEETEINLRDEIQLILSDKHRTPAEIYEELPRDVQLGTDQSEVKAVLERLANTGVISKKNEESTFRYFQRQGKTWE